MNYVYKVVLSNMHATLRSARWKFEVVAPSAKKAISKALNKAARGQYKGGWQVQKLVRRGEAV